MKKVLIYFVIVLVAINGLIIVSDSTYLYKGIANTYLKGRKGPGLFDLKTFPVDELSPATESAKLHHKTTLYKLTEADKDSLLAIRTNTFMLIHQDSVAQFFMAEDSLLNKPTNSFSMAKSIVSLCIGIAIEKGLIASIEEPVGNYLPPFNNGKLANITINHLLTMSSGLHWIESGANPFSHNAKAYYGNDLSSLILSLEYEKPPGEYFEYKSGNSQLLAAIVEQASGMSIAEFTEQYIWKKIGAENSAYWSLDREKGMAKAFCCFYANTADFGKLGLLMLHRGILNGDTIIPPGYIDRSIEPANLQTPEGESNRYYGKHWWVFQEDEPAWHGYYARGILGQYIMVFPKQALVLVRTGHQRKSKSDGYHPDDIYLYLNIAKDYIAHEKRHQSSKS